MPNVKADGPTRRRGGTQPEPLSVEDVTAAGLALVRRVGIEGVTIKALAAELGVTGPAVYHYVSGKEEVLDRLCERVTSSVDLTVDPALDWRERVVAIMCSLERTFSRHPGVGARALALRGPAPAADRISRTLRGIALDAGFEPGEAEELVVSLHLVFSGWLVGKVPDAAPPTEMTTDLLVRVSRRVLAGFTPPDQPDQASS